MVKEFTEKITVYITEEQKRRVKALPYDFNLSDKMRPALDRILDDAEKAQAQSEE